MLKLDSPYIYIGGVLPPPPPSSTNHHTYLPRPAGARIVRAKWVRTNTMGKPTMPGSFPPCRDGCDHC